MKRTLCALAACCMAVFRGFAADEPVARIGTTDYPTLQAAVSAAASNDVVRLLGDVVWTNATETTLIAVAADKRLTLDLDGHAVVATNSLAGATALFDVRGDLTVGDSSEAKTGLVAFAPTSPASYSEGSPEYASRVFRMAGGRVTLTGGTVEHRVYGSACYVFDAGGPSTPASEIVLSGAVIRAQCTIARLWAADAARPERFTLAAGSAVAAKGFGVQFFGAGESGTAEIAMTGGELKAPFCTFYLWRPRGGVSLDLRDGTVEGTFLDSVKSPYVIYESTSLKHIPARGHNRVRLSGMTVSGAGGCYFGDTEGSTDIEITSSKISASLAGMAAVKVYDGPTASESATLTIADSVLAGNFYSLWLEDAGACRAASLKNSTVTSGGIAITYYGPTSQSGPAKARAGTLAVDGGLVVAPYALFVWDDYASTSLTISDGAFDGAFCLCGCDLAQSDYKRRDGKPWVTVEGGTFADFGVDTAGVYCYIDGKNLAGIVLTGGTYDARLSLDEPTEFARVAYTRVYRPSATQLGGEAAWNVVPGVAVYALPLNHATWRLHTSFDEPISSNYLFAATNDSVTAVWTTLPGYVFDGGATAHTNSAATVRDPTSVSPLETPYFNAVALVGLVEYASFADAYAAASASETPLRITLLKDIVVGEPFAIDHSVIVDLNGHAFNGSQTGSFAVSGAGVTFKIALADSAFGGNVYGAITCDQGARVELYGGTYDTDVGAAGFVAAGHAAEEDEGLWTVSPQEVKTDAIELKKDGETVGTTTIDTSALAANAVGTNDVNATGANGLAVWESVALGLDANDPTSLPWVKPVQQQEDPTNLVVAVQEVVENDSIESARVKYTLLGADSRNGPWTELETREDQLFTVQRNPATGKFYKYYKTKAIIEIEDAE